MKVRDRLQLAAVALGAVSTHDPREALAAHSGRPDGRVAYIVLACLMCGIPTGQMVVDFVRRWRLDGFAVALRSASRRAPWSGPPIRVVDGIVIDVTDTAASRYTTGIQRVARECVRRWSSSGEALHLVTWDRRGTRLQEVGAASVAVGGNSVPAASADVLVPFGATLVLPEIAVFDRRSERLRVVADYGARRSVAIGFDCIPVTSAETTALGMPGAFSDYLATLARFDEVLAISEAAGEEYAGWRHMLAGSGIQGPSVEVITLPAELDVEATADDVNRVSAELGLRDETVLLVVGSHEPRKNHLAILEAAELLWADGREFALVMVGGNAWNTDAFDATLDRLRRRGRRVLTLSGVSDATIRALYSLALFSIFPSLNEGFGLPVAESLAVGTPVITSSYGSMRAIGEGYGAVCVDPRNVAELESAMRTLLDDDSEIGRLRDESAGLPESTWDRYASDVWSHIAHP